MAEASFGRTCLRSSFEDSQKESHPELVAEILCLRSRESLKVSRLRIFVLLLTIFPKISGIEAETACS